ncbi:MAG: DNA polymerase I [Nitrospinota bacterium]|nr:MAG: DNA polymerase I [Nitrospinota bacterium]
MGTPERLFLIDGSALAYRSYFAFIRNPLYTSRGENTSAVYGFTVSLLQLLQEEQPTFLAVIFDTPEPTFRHEKYAEYKATREKMPDEMLPQLPRIKEIIAALQIPIVEIPGYEADDVMGTLAKQAAAQGIDVWLVTGDKDFMQLVSERIKIYSLRKEGEEREILDPERVRQKLGVPPEQVVEVLALMGDKSDNVPGIPQIGEKTAVKLIQRYGTVEAVLAHAGEISQKRIRENLLAYGQQALLSKELVTIHTDVPLSIDLEQLRVGKADTERLRTLFQQLEFASLLGELAPSSPQETVRYHTVTDARAWEELLARLSHASSFVFDLETTHIDPLQAEIIGIAFAFAPHEAYYVPLVFPEQTLLPSPATEGAGMPSDILQRLRPILADPRIRKCGQNIKYDILALSRYDIPVQGIDFDTMVASYVLNPSRRQHNLDALSLEYLNYQKTPITALIGSGKKQKNMREVPLAEISRYACEDADITLRLRQVLEPKLRETGTFDLFQQVEIPLISVLADMEKTGVLLDLPLLKRMSQTLAQRLEELQQEIYALAGETFNINSTQQLGKILFEKLEIHKDLGIKKIRKTKTGYATDVQVLEQFKSHPLVQKILDYRQIVKLKSTYIDALPKLVNPFTGRVHTSFNQTVTATGRLSSSNPNLQNIPIRTELGREIRKAFIPRAPDHCLLSADYSQIELRILAHLSQDQNLMEAFQQGEDIHRQTAARILGIAPEAVTDEQRNRAKAINFGIIYGMGAQRLAREVGISVAEAERFIAAYFEHYPGVYRYINSTIEQARERGYVTTLLNRRRYLPELQSEDPRVRNTAEKVAINTPIQGTAADLIKVAMITIHRALQEEKMATRMLLQVHDELVFELPQREKDKAIKLIKEAMEGAIQLRVPIKVDIGIGQNWLEAH